MPPTNPRKQAIPKPFTSPRKNSTTHDQLRHFLDTHYEQFNAQEYLNIHPDPLQIPYQYRDFPAFDELCLLCALYAYGNAKLIVQNLSTMPFESLLDLHALRDMPAQNFPYYRFQTRQDTKDCFLILAEMRERGGVREIFAESYRKRQNVLDGIQAIERAAAQLCAHSKRQSYGLQFLFGNPKNATSPCKRYNMFLRWLVRRDNLDFGIWNEVSTRDLLLPLDTHTFKIAQKLGLCQSKTYNLKAVQEITNILKTFDSDDPIKYDFALYRIGQLGLQTPSIPHLR